MPQLIKGGSYTATLQDVPISGGRRAEGSDAGADVFAAVRDVGRSAQKAADAYLEDTELREQRKVLVEQAKIRQRYAKELEDAELSGADVNEIKARLEDDLSKIGENMATKRGVDAAAMHGANTLNIFDTAVNSINVRRSATEAKVGARDLIAAQSGLIANNPSYLPIAIDEIDQYMDTFGGRLTPGQIGEMKQGLRQQMNVHAVSSLIRLAPDDAKMRLEKGEWDLSPEQRIQELGRAESQIRAIRAEKAAERAEAEYELRKVSDSARDEWFREIMNNTPGTLKQIIGDLRLTPEHREHLVVFHENWLKAKFGADRQSDPRLVNNLLLDIHAPEGSPRKIYTADKIYEALQNSTNRTGSGLSATDFRMLLSEVSNSRDPNNNTVSRRYGEALNVVSNAIRTAPEFIAQPDLQASAILSWAAAVRDRMDEERKQNRNPTSLFDPMDKSSVVRPEYINQFIKAARAEKITSDKLRVNSTVKKGDVLGGYEFVGNDNADRGDPRNWVKSDKPDTVLLDATQARQLPARHPVFGGVTVPPAASRSQSLESRIKSQYPRRRHESEKEYFSRITEFQRRAVEAGAQ